MADISELIAVPIDPNTPVRVRRFMQQVADTINSLLRSDQITRAALGTYTISVRLSTNSGLQLDGNGALSLDLDTLILEITGNGVRFANQSGATVFAAPANGSNGPPTFRALSANDLPDLSGEYQPLDADLSAIANLTGNGANGIPYRISPGSWGQLNLGGNLTFANGTLDATAAGGGGNVTINGNTGTAFSIASGNGIDVTTLGNTITIAGNSVLSVNGAKGALTLANGPNVTIATDLGNSAITIGVNVDVGGAGNISGNTSNLPPANGPLQTFQPTDSPVLYVSNGTAWYALASGKAPTTPPSTSVFTNTHNASGNLTQAQGEAWILYYSALDVGANSRHGWTHAASGNWTVTMAAEVVRGQYQGGTMCFGLMIRRASDSHFLEWMRIQSASVHRVLMQLWSDETNFAGGLSHGDEMAGFWPQLIYWQRVTHNSVAGTLTFEWSYDGFIWMPWVTYTYDSFLSGLDQVGVVGQNFGSNGSAYAKLWHYSFVSLP